MRTVILIVMVHEKVNVKMRLTRRHLVMFLVVFGLVLVGYGTYTVYSMYFKPIYTASLDGQLVNFRADLREANKVEVLPSQQVLENVLNDRIISPGTLVDGILKEPIRNITIVFKPVSTDQMGWYSVEAAEIAAKVKGIYSAVYGVDININSEPVDSYDNLSTSGSTIIVALVHPQIANATFVKADPITGVVTISGAGSLRNFDLATVKFMMVAFGISI